MSLGIVGPIGSDNLAEFAIARAFRLSSSARANSSSARCKVCGEALPKGAGREVLISGLHPGQYDRAYLCSGRLGRIEAAYRRFLPGAPASS
jgi:hypothetical protein